MGGLFIGTAMLDNILGDNKPVAHLPIGSLRSHGTNTFDEPLYRVVWSESRYAQSGGKHVIYEGAPSSDATVKARGKDPNFVREEIGYKWIPVYPGITAWVLEKWKSAFSSTGMSEETWNWQYKDLETGLLELGPYPSRGDYWHCYTFPAGHAPGSMKVAEVISWIEAGRNYSLDEHRQAILQQKALTQKDWASRVDAAQRDAIQVGGLRPLNLRPGKKSPEQKINFKHAAEDVGLNPAHRGASVGEPIQRGT